ncbi:hypothetical protein [Rhodococcus sp. OK302]|nr:hypothetical protein [Rhodococcus sp. OK302]
MSVNCTEDGYPKAVADVAMGPWAEIRLRPGAIDCVGDVRGEEG